jgi:hypothetical protein
MVLFVYLHIQFHLKTSDDLEMYELEFASKDKFEEICNLRQPVLFDFDNDRIIQTGSLDYLANTYGAFEIKIRNSESGSGSGLDWIGFGFGLDWIGLDWIWIGLDWIGLDLNWI